MAFNEGLFLSGNQEYETPQSLFDTLDAEFGFNLDAAASIDNHKVPYYFTKGNNALGMPWLGIVWCNPPYGREIGAFVEKGHDESVAWDSTVVMLLPARTDTRWWHDYVMRASEIRFIKGRLKFVGEKNSAPFPSCIVVFDAKESDRQDGPIISAVDKTGLFL